jgi:hypothetical protein
MQLRWKIDAQEEAAARKQAEAFEFLDKASKCLSDSGAIRDDVVELKRVQKRLGFAVDYGDAWWWNLRFAALGAVVVLVCLIIAITSCIDIRERTNAWVQSHGMKKP